MTTPSVSFNEVFNMEERSQASLISWKNRRNIPTLFEGTDLFDSKCLALPIWPEPFEEKTETSCPRASNSFTHGPILAAAAAFIGGNSEVTTAIFKTIFPAKFLLLFRMNDHLHKVQHSNPIMRLEHLLLFPR